jgi:hypothetical protein
MQTGKLQNTNIYFAAANGFSGFRSYFSGIFNPIEYERIYVLKGGPGTGKSSLMKKILAAFSDELYCCDAILCSSDPKSLDGVIIRQGKRQVAILDGTAPHETDAKIPGAIDEVINLGSFWSQENLREQRDSIISLNKAKGNHYKNAYEYLSLAGIIRNKISSFLNLNSKIDLGLFDKFLKHENLDIFSGRNNKFVIKSAFGKDGYFRLQDDFSDKKIINISGIFGSEFIYLNRAYEYAKAMGVSTVRLISPFGNDITEGIYFPHANVLLFAGEGSDSFDSAALINQSELKAEYDKLEYYNTLYNDFLSRSQHEFMKASENHFMLEAIYSPAMDFSKVDSLSEELIEKIKSYLIF